MEVGRADGLAHEVPVGARRVHRDLLLRQDVQQLLPHLLRLAQHCERGITFLEGQGFGPVIVKVGQQAGTTSACLAGGRLA